MTTVTHGPSKTFQTIQAFQHRDDRGGDITHNGLPSKSTEDAVKPLWRSSPGWPDKNADGRYNVTYEFRTPPEHKPKKLFNKTGFSHVLENQRQQTRLSLRSIEDVANVKFNEGAKTASSEGHITIGNYAQKIDTKGYSYNGNPHAVLPQPNEERSGDAWFVANAGDATVPNAAPGNAGRYTIIHELGHTMGLAHPGNYNGSLDKSKVRHHEDSQSHTVMSYKGERTGYMNHGGFRASAPQLDDISAYQDKYGANYETRQGDTVYGFNSNTDRDFLSVKSAKDKIVAAIWDGGGKDTLDFSGYTQDQQISLKEGTFSDIGGLKGNVGIAHNAVIENATGGSGNDLLVGNDVANELKGGGGNDRLYGAGGADKLWGGKGRDVCVYGAINESTQAALDQIMDFVSGEDSVDVSGITAALGKESLTFVSAFSGASGEAILNYDSVLNASTLQISGMPEEANFVLFVHGKLQRSDIVS